MGTKSIDGTRSSDDDTSSNRRFLDPIMKSDQQSVFDALFYVKGRGYINNDSIKYLMPSDVKEVSRMNRQHVLFRYIWQNNYSAPIEESLLVDSRVLDVGCGTGAWVVDMSREWQFSSFIGIDVAPNFPTGPQKPGNAAFIQRNVLEGIPFPSHTFDFVRMSNLMTTIPEKHWMAALKEMVRICKATGWVEVGEMDCIYYDCGPVAKRLIDTLNRNLNGEGINTTPTLSIPKHFEEVGLFKLCSDERTYPIGGWAGRYGEMILEDFLEGYESLKTILPRVLGVTDDEYETLLREFAREVNEYKTFVRAYRFWGQKPRRL